MARKAFLVVVLTIGVSTLAFGQAMTLLSEDFESWPPAGWTITNDGGDCVWDSTANTGRSNYAGGDGDAADADADVCGSGTTMNTGLVTPVLDMSGAASATLTFVASFNYLSNDTFEVNVTTDGATWTNLLRWQEDHDAYGPGETVTLDLTPYISATTQVEFRYIAPGWDWYAEVDQVRIDIAGGGGTDADLAITKTAGVSGAVHPGDQFAYTLTVTNNGPADATGVVVTDVLPAGLTYVSDSCGGSWNAGTGTWTWTIGALSASTNVSCDLTVEVAPGANGTITNVATVTGNENDPDGANSTASADVTASSRIPGIPAQTPGGVAVMVLLLVGAALLVLRRRV